MMPTTQPLKAKRQVFRNEKQQIVAEVRGDTLYKEVRGSKHMLRKPPAWALDYKIFERAEAAGIQWVVVNDLEGDKYIASIATFRSLGMRLNRGYGDQIALPLGRWEKVARSDPRHS
jgi:hypothetical protein